MLAKRTKTVTAWLNLGVGAAFGSFVGTVGYGGVGVTLGVLGIVFAVALHQHDGLWQRLEASIAHE